MQAAGPPAVERRVGSLGCLRERTLAIMDGLSMAVRVRFAPSPSGFLHLGGARTALFNWLFARQNQGTFILRIEDTDRKRSSDEMIQGILEGLTWLGLSWDEGPYFQSRRRNAHAALVQKLLHRGSAYCCFCSPEEKASLGPAPPSSHDDPCRNLSTSDADLRRERGNPFAVRFKVPADARVIFRDRVFGQIEVQAENLDDFVLRRSDGRPTYHLCVVADDLDMGISHVIRGADHLSNTGKHVLLYQALGEPPPIYVHLPLILGADRQRLSKRHGATAVLEYREEGILPQALRNYLALLGWSPGDNREVFSELDLIHLFQLRRIHKTNAVFDPRKLEWLNGQYIRQLQSSELADLVEPDLEKKGCWNPAWSNEKRDWFLQLTQMLQPRLRRLDEFADMARPFFADECHYEPEAVQKHLQSVEPTLKEALEELRRTYDRLSPFATASAEKAMREIAQAHDLRAGVLIGAVRVALTGKTSAPGIFDVIHLLGKEKTVLRLRRLLSFLR